MLQQELCQTCARITQAPNAGADNRLQVTYAHNREFNKGSQEQTVLA